MKPNQTFHNGEVFMEMNGLTCILNMPPALEHRFDDNGEELDQSLPPYAQRHCFNVDDYAEACPASWMRGSAKEASYFVPVKSEHGLWLDFNRNLGHSHQVAVVISSQGINAVTGLPTEGALRLEQYREKCPKHDTAFGGGRFCEPCGFKWPHQNYLATTGTQSGLFWLDGFRAKDGRVRQFVFTEEEMRGVAAQIIGEKRVFAIGIAFYLSKNPKPPPPPPVSFTRGGGGVGVMASASKHYLAESSAVKSFGGGPSPDTIDTLESLTDGAPLVACAASVEEGGEETFQIRRDSSGPAPNPVLPKKRLEIAAGARIHQEVYPDSEELSFWQDEPAGILYINYCDEDTAREILSQGKRDRTARGEGFMSDLKVGHPGSADH